MKGRCASNAGLTATATDDLVMKEVICTDVCCSSMAWCIYLCVSGCTCMLQILDCVNLYVHVVVECMCTTSYMSPVCIGKHD